MSCNAFPLRCRNRNKLRELIIARATVLGFNVNGALPAWPTVLAWNPVKRSHQSGRRRRRTLRTLTYARPLRCQVQYYYYHFKTNDYINNVIVEAPFAGTTFSRETIWFFFSFIIFFYVFRNDHCHRDPLFKGPLRLGVGMGGGGEGKKRKRGAGNERAIQHWHLHFRLHG